MGPLTMADRLTKFFDQLRSASTRVLLLDYDGTLAPFKIEREQAFPYPEVPPLLGQIMAKGTRVVLISGRAAHDVLQLSGIMPAPEIWGSHGLERLRAGCSYEVEPLSPEQERGIHEALEILQSHKLESRMERKPSGIALHWRGLATAEIDSLKRQVGPAWRELAERNSLELLDFDGGLEVRVRGKDKGNAVSAILKESDQDAAVAYLGDDRTDEDAFRVLRGRGLTALVRAEPRPTLAEIQLRPPEELIEFLRKWVSATEREN